MYGYSGRFLSIDLASGRTDAFAVSEEALWAVIGGSGLGAWLFLQRGQPEVEPLSPGNTLWILNGPLAGTGFPGSSRFAVCARSPLTGLWGEAAVGGNFGPVLRQAGWDGIELKGSAVAPRILVIDAVRAAARLGGEAPEWAIAVKGLELPYHDPRAYHGMGLAYAYSSRGGCHNQHSAYPVEQGMVSWPELGLRDDWQGQTSEGKAAMVALCENYGLLASCLCQCHFVNYVTRPADLLAALNAATGLDRNNLDELLRCGERVWHLKRGLINLMGARDRDDRLPRRLLEPLSEGGAAGSAPDLSKMKREYKQIRGLGEDGVAGAELLRRLGLGELAARLHGG